MGIFDLLNNQKRFFNILSRRRFKLQGIFLFVTAILVFVSVTATYASTLTSIAVTPADPAILVGETQQFTATGTFSNGSIETLTHATAVTTGNWHACVLLPDGTVKCWGSDGGAGALGNGSNSNSSIPVMVSGITTATAISAGVLHTCALLSDNTVKCWGYNSYGQLGNGTTSSAYTPVSVSGISNATAIAAGNDHSCAVLSDGTIKCWGDNTYGQLGNGTTVSSSTPVSVSGITNAVAVAAGSGYSHTCALLTDGSVNCWGSNSYGQLGNGTTISSSSPVPVSGITTATAISAGSLHTCALLSDGTVKCWGHNSTTPVAVIGISNATSIAAGSNHTCAVLSDGTAKCWGLNSDGELGNGTLTYSSTPVLVSGISNAMKIATGYNYTCAIHSYGTVNCWGYNRFGQLGNGLIGYSITPVSVNGVFNATRITAGSHYTCAVLSDGATKCWGLNNYGQLGDGSTGYSTMPVSVIGISHALSITAGVSQTCVILPDNTVQCWGSSNGVSVSNVASVAVGRSHTCVLLIDSTVKCWGSNTYGQLGNGSNTNSNAPVPVNGISNATAIAAGTNHTCAVLSDGTTKCWGLNDYGQLGDGSNTNANTPVSVSGISNATTVTAGYSHTCALLSDATLKCWGVNYWGQLGNGSQINSNTPVSVNGISNATTVTSGVEGGHTCALLSDATIKCWGSNISGQLGNGSKSYAATTPVSVSGITNASAVATGNSHTCAILSDSSIQCWGDNWYGALGDGTAGISSIPDQVIGIVNIVWDSSNTATASIYASGLATGITPGITTITGTSGGISGSTTLDVHDIYTLTVTRTGSGMVTSIPVGIDCGVDCTEPYLNGTVVTLTTTPDAGSAFTGWSGNVDCSDGIVTMDTNKTCIATFVKTWFEENDPAVIYTGTWSNYACASCSAGGAKISNTTGSKAEFSFTGTGIKWIVAKGPMMGKARVYLDGVNMGLVDLYSPTLKYQVKLPKTGLTPGNHTLTLEVSGQKNTSSTGTYINIDAFEIVP